MFDQLYTYKITDVVKNYDGDTVTVVIDVGFHITRQERIRLLNIDTEELRGGTVQSKARGYAGKDRLAELLAMGQVYVITEKDHTGKYGRLLGWLYVKQDDGKIIDVNKTLVAEGYEKGVTTPLIESVQYTS